MAVSSIDQHPQLRHQTPSGEEKTQRGVEGRNCNTADRAPPGALTTTFHVYIATVHYLSQRLAAGDMPGKLVHRLWSLKGFKKRLGSASLFLKAQMVRTLGFASQEVSHDY